MKIFDCDLCAYKPECEDAQTGTFCTRFCSVLPDPERKDPYPDGWEEDE